MDVRVFSSKIDWWLGVILVALPVGSLFALGLLIVEGAGAGEIWVGVGGVTFVAALYGLLVVPVRYELHAQELVIRFGVVRSRVAYASIIEVKPTRNPLSNPALSLDRLHINAGSALGPCISPADKGGFLTELAQRAPHLRHQGDCLVPAHPDA